MCKGRRQGREGCGDGGRGGGAYSFVACLGHVTNDHTSLSRRSTVPTPNRNTSNNWALIAFRPYRVIFAAVLFQLVVSNQAFWRYTPPWSQPAMPYPAKSSRANSSPLNGELKWCHEL